MGDTAIGTARRYYLGKRTEARMMASPGMDTVWKAKQEAEPGTALASTFPHLSALSAVGYTTTEDLTGADEDELVYAGLTRSQARDVIAALT